MTAKSDELVDELVSACIAFGRGVAPDWQTRIEKARVALREYIEGLEPRWIPVSERLPDVGIDVFTLVYDANDDSTSVHVLTHHGDGKWFSWDTGCYVVTHWMPLPPNPESPNDTQTQTVVYGKESER